MVEHGPPHAGTAPAEVATGTASKTGSYTTAAESSESRDEPV